MSKQLDVLFIHPNAAEKIYQDLSRDFSAIEPPIWAALLANHVRAKGYSCAILDCEAERLSVAQALEAIHDRNPRLAAFIVYGQQPSASTQNMTGVSLLNNALKDTYPQYPTIAIGLYPSALPEKTLQDEKLDFVGQGEGAATLVGLCQIDDKGDHSRLRQVPGLWYRHDGAIVAAGPAHNIAQEMLPQELPGMAWDLLPMKKYRTSNWHAFTNNNQNMPFASLYTSLGCPFKCSFCCINAPFGGSSFRYWSPEFILGEFDKIADMGIINVKIADEMFVLNQNHFMKVCQLIAGRGHHFNIWAYARIDTVKEEYLETLKKAGVNWLALGIESGVKTVRADVIKGKFEDINIRDVVQKIREHGISVIGNFIFGLPEDTEETMRQTLDLALEMKCDMINFYSCMAYPGSALHHVALEQKWELPDTYAGYSQHAYETKPLPTKHISAREVLAFRDRAFTRYFSDPGYLAFVKEKFGQETFDNIAVMNSHKLRRAIVEKSAASALSV